jgi:hypothetical protein
VGRIYRTLDRGDRVESAELGTSELVTNAVLHGEEPIVVMVRGTTSHPRVEVHDGSTVLPDPPTPDDEDDELTTFGRGLSIVARCAYSWGATSAPEGKVVWFEPSADGHESFVEGLIEVPDEVEPEPRSESAVPVVLGGFDVPLMSELARQYSELRRELRLLALSHHETYPLATDLVAMFVSYERQFPPEFGEQIAHAHAHSRRRIDMVVPMAPEAAPIFTTMVDMFDLADEFCRAERLLSLERSPRQRAFHTWMLTEIVAQVAGEPPTVWQDVDPTGSQPQPVA